MAQDGTYAGERFRWQRREELSGGGQGTTWWATKVDDGSTDWILKFLRADRAGAKPQARLKNEAEAYDRLKCDGIPKLEDYSLEAEPFLVTPYVGEDIEKKYHASGFPSLEETLVIFKSLVEATKCAHELGVLHRDIKPANVTLNGSKVSLIDWGICTDLDGETTLTTTGEGFGTHAFTAPECSPGSYDLATATSDIYSLGKLFYWMASEGRLINREEFDERHISEIRHQNHWIRNAAAHLVSGTVVSRQWSAQELLDWVDWLQTKIEQHSAAADRGHVIIWDGLGPAGEVNLSGTKHVSFQSPPRYDHRIAVGFEIPDNEGLIRLEEIALGVRLQAGTGRLRVMVTTVDRDDSTNADRQLPDRDRPIEVFETVATARDSEIIRLPSSVKPILEQGHRYWVCLSTPDPGTTVGWFAPQVAYLHVPAWVARHADEYPDGTAGRVKAPGYALQVTARSV